MASGSDRGGVLCTELGGRLALRGVPDRNALGQALRAFLACDRREFPREGRSALAEEILGRWGVAAYLRADDAVNASDRFWNFVSSRFPNARVRREVPVHAVMGSQEVVGRVDVLVDLGGSFAIVDHKSSPGRRELWESVARSQAPQSALYATAVSAATGMTCCGLFIHMPVLGLVVQVGLPEAAS